MKNMESNLKDGKIHQIPLHIQQLYSINTLHPGYSEHFWQQK